MHSLVSFIPISTNRFVGKNKRHNVNRGPNHEHIFMKQNFSVNFSSGKCIAKDFH